MNPKANTKKEKGFVLNPEINYKKAGKKKQINRKAKQNFPKETSKKLKLKPNIERKKTKNTPNFYLDALPGQISLSISAV